MVSSTTSLEDRRPQDLSAATLWSSESDQVDRLLEGHLLEAASNETLLEEEEEHHDEEEEHHDEEEEHHDEEDEHMEGHDDHSTEGHEDHDDHSDHDDHGSLAASSLLESGSDKPWGDVIVAALIINLITLTGVLFLSGEFFAKHVLKRDIAGSPYYKKFTHLIIPSFACGALMATTVFLVLPEALYLISAHFSGSEEGEDEHAGHGHRFLEEDGHEEEEGNAEGAAIWRFGACIIGGFLLPILTAALFPHNHHDLEEVIETEGVPAGADGELDTLKEEVEGETAIKVMEEQPAAMTVKTDSGSTGSDTLPLPIDWPLAASIMAGDFFHNFAGKFTQCMERFLQVWHVHLKICFYFLFSLRRNLCGDGLFALRAGLGDYDFGSHDIPRDCPRSGGLLYVDEVLQHPTRQGAMPQLYQWTLGYAGCHFDCRY